jgi:hypothetical protein
MTGFRCRAFAAPKRLGPRRRVSDGISQKSEVKRQRLETRNLTPTFLILNIEQGISNDEVFFSFEISASGGFGVLRFSVL